MKAANTYKKAATLFIALVWLLNGLFCKVMNFAPRHKQIVGEITGFESAEILTKLIGFAEVLMSLWIISRISTRLNTIVQISIIALMNILEFFLVPHLLLWGKINILFALLFIIFIYWNEFYHQRTHWCEPGFPLFKEPSFRCWSFFWNLNCTHLCSS